MVPAPVAWKLRQLRSVVKVINGCPILLGDGESAMALNTLQQHVVICTNA